MTEVYAADLGSNPYGSDERSSSTIRGYVATFNTPSNSFNTIVIPKVYGGNVGDVIKVGVYKGSIPNDPNTDDDNTDSVAKLDQSDLVEEVTYNITTAIAAGGIDIEFPFTTTFTQAILGDTYTVCLEQFDSSGAYVPFSIVFCTDRDGVDNYINDTDATAQYNFQGGAGNVYYFNGAQLNSLVSFGFTKYSINLTASNGTTEWSVNGTVVRDPCPAWGIYSREVVTLNSTVYGTTRALTAPLTGALTSNLI